MKKLDRSILGKDVYLGENLPLIDDDGKEHHMIRTDLDGKEVLVISKSHLKRMERSWDPHSYYTNLYRKRLHKFTRAEAKQEELFNKSPEVRRFVAYQRASKRIREELRSAADSLASAHLKYDWKNDRYRVD